MSIPERILDKARKLRALSERGGTPAESASAARRFAELVERYRIRQADLQKEEVVFGAVPLLSSKRAAGWRVDLAYVIACHYGVLLYREVNPSTKDARWMMVGGPDDIEATRYLFAWLAADAVRLAAEYTDGADRVSRRSWLMGFVHGIQQQLIAARETIAADQAGQPGLVLVGGRLDKAKETFEARLAQHNHAFRKPSSRRAVEVDGMVYENACIIGRDHHLGKSLEHRKEEEDAS